MAAAAATEVGGLSPDSSQEWLAGESKGLSPLSSESEGGPLSRDEYPQTAGTRSKIPSTRSASRILCLKLQNQKGQRSPQAVAEAFLKYSPRLQFRQPDFLFIDIASTAHFFGGEEALLSSAQALAQSLGFSSHTAISDTPAGAQLFALTQNRTIVPRNEEKNCLKHLPLSTLLYLEGLKPWPHLPATEGIVSFFLSLGFKTIGDLSRFTLASFQERWNETGTLLWKRLNAQDHQVISPLIPTEPLQDYVHLDFPVCLVSLLLHQMDKSFDFLFARLQGRCLFARKMSLILHCEYSNVRHKIEIEPNTPSRNRELFFTLLENRLAEVNLENPIRDYEIDVLPCPEKNQQLDFFEPRTTDQDKLQTLLNLFSQSSLKAGLYRIQPTILPEHAWTLTQDPDQTLSLVAERTQDYRALGPNNKISTAPMAITPQPRYGQAITHAPRPTRLLIKPTPLSIPELQKLKILSINPIERLEAHWWEDDMRRDYYFAISPTGQCLWIYQDLQTEEYFLHGYFD